MARGALDFGYWGYELLGQQVLYVEAQDFLCQEKQVGGKGDTHPKTTVRAKEATRVPVNEYRTYRSADTLIDEIDPLGREPKEGKSFKKERPAKFDKSLGDVELHTQGDTSCFLMKFLK